MKAALIIGCSRYDSPAIADIDFACEDADQFAELLREHSGFAAENIYVLSSRESDFRHRPTRNNIISSLTLFRRESPPPESIEQFVFYFSGHGFHSVQDGRDYLLPRTALIRA